MAVHGDGLARRRALYQDGLVPEDWPSIRETTGFDPLAPLCEERVMYVIRYLFYETNMLIANGRFCVLCNSDLSDPGAPKSNSRAGFKAATGVYPQWTAAIPSGGHAPDCAVVYLLRWIGMTGSWARLRTHDVDDGAAKVLVAGKEPMELVGTDLEKLTPEQRIARAEVLRGLGLTEEALHDSG